MLSLFPGIDALGLAFEQEMPGACVVRGPDPIYGSLHDVRSFHPPPGVFWGVVGGPPCQIWSRLKYLNPLAGQKHGNLIPEFERIVAEAQPRWFVMENVPEAPAPVVPGYAVHAVVFNNRWAGGVQHRIRRFSFGTPDGLHLCPEVVPLEAPLSELAVTAEKRAVPFQIGGSGKVKRRLRPPTVLAGHGSVSCESDECRGLTHRSVAEMCELQGLPPDFADEIPLTEHGKRKVIGNAVPLFTGRAIARAVMRALGGTP